MWEETKYGTISRFFSYLIVVVLHGQSIIFLHFPIAHFCNRQKKKDLAKKVTIKVPLKAQSECYFSMDFCAQNSRKHFIFGLLARKANKNSWWITLDFKIRKPVQKSVCFVSYSSIYSFASCFGRNLIEGSPRLEMQRILLSMHIDRLALQNLITFLNICVPVYVCRDKTIPIIGHH